MALFVAGLSLNCQGGIEMLQLVIVTSMPNAAVVASILFWSHAYSLQYIKHIHSASLWAVAHHQQETRNTSLIHSFRYKQPLHEESAYVFFTPCLYLPVILDSICQNVTS